MFTLISLLIYSVTLQCPKARAYVISSSSLQAISSMHNIFKVNNGSIESTILDWHEPLVKKYIESRNATAEYEQLDLTILREETAKNLSTRLFKPRRTALGELVAGAEAVAKSYNWKNKARGVDYKDAWSFSKTNATDEDEDGRVLRFPKPVNFNYSVVHVPTEIHVGPDSTEYDTLQGLDWTNQLDEYFIKAEADSNNKSDQDPFLWMYFGSTLGFVRHYPANQWVVEDTGSRFQNRDVDLYDSRRTRWYNQGSNSAKDVMIMIDTSGSTAGQTLYLMALTVQKLLDTLGEDDFFHVATFSDTKRQADGHTGRLGPKCFPEFVQATSFNKGVIMDAVKKMRMNKGSPVGQANFEVALQYAFNKFEKHQGDADTKFFKRTANCSNTIIILTDGGIEKPDKVIYTHSLEGNGTREYRIFTYAMGKAPTPLDAVRWLACTNRGYFSMINSISTIDAGVQDYTHVLPRSVSYEASKGLDRLSTIQWSYPDPQLGLGMMTTLTMPVFNRSDEKNVSLLGVMGIDVSLDEFDKYIPFRELGPLSYTLLINHNGFVVRHPALKPQQAWNDEPPSIDILDVEVVKTDEAMRIFEKQVRERMLEKKDIQMRITDAGAVIGNGNDNYAYFISYTREYFTRNVDNTAYRLAMARPLLINKVLKVSYTDDHRPSSSVFTTLDNMGFDISIAKWDYCEDIIRFQSRDNQTGLFDTLEKLEEHGKCSADMLNHLLLDAQVVLDTDLTRIVVNGTAISISLTTAGGLTVVYPDTGDSENILSMKNNFLEPATKRAYANYDEYIYTAQYSQGSVEVIENTTGPHISIYKAVNDEVSYPGLDSNLEGPYVFGVVGVTIENTQVASLLEDTRDVDGDALCNSSQSNSCFLLDEGGFIIAENVHKAGFSHIGQWVGVVDKSLMYALYNSEDDSQPPVYLRHKHHDYQSVCKWDWLSETTRSDATRLPTLGQISETLMTHLTTGVMIIFNSMMGYNSVDSLESLEYGENYVTCMSVSYQYYYNDDKDATFNKTLSFIHSDGCERTVQTEKISGTNLLLVVADKASKECDSLAELPQKPLKYMNSDIIEEDKVEEDNQDSFVDESICQRHRRLRVAPTQCYSKDKEGFPYSCDACRQATISTALIVSSVCIYLAMLA